MFSHGAPTILWRLRRRKLRVMVNLVCMLAVSMFPSRDTFLQLETNTPYHMVEKLLKNWAIPLLLPRVGTHFLALMIQAWMGRIPVVSVWLATLGSVRMIWISSGFVL